MNEQVAIHLAAGAMTTAAKIAAPILLSAMIVGLAVSLFQSVTQIQEMTLTFVPKLLVVALVIGLAGHWMLVSSSATSTSSSARCHSSSGRLTGDHRGQRDRG